jgi:hypothetical protein
VPISIAMVAMTVTIATFMTLAVAVTTVSKVHFTCNQKHPETGFAYGVYDGGIPEFQIMFSGEH